jgi:hypothetical protein
MDASKHLPVGSKVKVKEPGSVPRWSMWDDDKGRTSGPVKKRLQEMFFKGDRKISAEIVFVSKESEREKLQRDGRCKVRLREPSGSCITITADPSNLVKAI